jgi:hypothetical protein
MNQKVVLPRFDLPRDSTRIAIRALCAAGALMVVAVMVLGLAMWHRRSVEIATAEEAAAKAAAIRRAAMAPPAPVVPARTQAPAPLALAGTSETTMAAVIPAAAEPVRRPAASHARRAGKLSAHARSGGRASSATAAKSAGGVTGKRAKVDDDFIDKLLNK